MTMTSSAVDTAEPPVAPATRLSTPLRYILVAQADVLRAARCVDAVRDRRLGVLVARDGSEATSVLATVGAPMLLVIDLSLPGRDAFKVVDAVRHLALDVPVLALAPCEEVRSAVAVRRPELGISRAILSSAGIETIRDAVGDLLGAQSSRSHDSAAASLTLSELVESAQQVTGAAGAAVYIHEPGSNRMEARVVWSGTANDQALYSEPRIFDWIRETGQPIVMPDLGGEPVVPQLDDRASGAIRGLVAVPVRGAAGEIIGVLCAFDVKPLAIDVDGLNALKLLGEASRRVSHPNHSSLTPVI